MWAIAVTKGNNCSGKAFRTGVAPVVTGPSECTINKTFYIESLALLQFVSFFCLKKCTWLFSNPNVHVQTVNIGVPTYDHFIQEAILFKVDRK